MADDLTRANTMPEMDIVENKFDGVTTQVENRFDKHTAVADAAIQTVTTQVSALTNSISSANFPTPTFSWSEFTPADTAIVRPTYTSTTYTPIDLKDPPVAPTLQAQDPDIPEFQSQIDSFNLPDPLVLDPVGAVPTKPDLVEVTFTEDVEVKLPPEPTIDDVVFPTFAEWIMPTYDGSMPDKFGKTLVPKFEYEEPTYHPELLDEVIPTIRAMWNGELGLPERTIQDMIRRAFDAEDIVLKQNIDMVHSEFTARGFTMPTGLQLKRIDKLCAESALRKNTIVRDINTRVSEVAVENQRFGVERYIEVQGMLFNIHSNITTRVFESAKYVSDLAVIVYNAEVAAYNTELQRADLEVQIYTEKVKAAIALLERDRLELQKAEAQGQLNEQKVRIYLAKVEAVKTNIELFKARMQAASIKAETNRTIIEGYKADVSAFSELLNAQKTRAEVYEATIRGETSKAAIIQAEVSAYTAGVQGKTAKANLQSAVDQNRTALYSETMKGFLGTADVRIRDLERQIRVVTADVERYKAEVGLEEAAARVAISNSENFIKSQIGMMNANIANFSAISENTAKRVSLVVEGQKAIMGAASALATGAMAGVHVTAQMGAHANLSGNASVNQSVNIGG